MWLASDFYIILKIYCLVIDSTFTHRRGYVLHVGGLRDKTSAGTAQLLQSWRYSLLVVMQNGIISVKDKMHRTIKAML